MAQRRRGICSVTSAPMASSTGSARATPPKPFKKARLSSRMEPGICDFPFLRLLLEKQLAVRHVNDHVPHSVSGRLQREGIPLQIVEFIVSQATPDSVGFQVFEHA